MSQVLLARQYLDIVDDSNILDIGCGFGENFSMLKKMKINSNFFAIEAGENYTNRLLELGVSLLSTKDGGVELDKNYTGFFDIIFMSHVLEHFNANELETIVGNISKYLKDDGIFVCEVPNDDFRIRDLEGNNQAPHLSFFSIDSIRNLFNNRGLSINFISACGKVILTEKKSDLNIDITKKSFFGKLKCILYKNQFIKKTIRLIRYAAYNSIYSRYKYMIENKLNLLLLSNEFSYDVDRSKIRVVAHRIRANNE
jgi:SAM-dependent methyltransferase